MNIANDRKRTGGVKKSKKGASLMKATMFPPSKASKDVSGVYRSIANRAGAGYSEPPDVVVGLSEESINKFLEVHFKNNPKFYDRSREERPKNPLHEVQLIDHGVQRPVKFWAKVVKPDANTSAVIVDLKSDPARDSRFQAWWRSSFGARSTPETKFPPNVLVKVSRAVLQINFPMVDDPNREHKIDFPFDITAACFLMLVDGDKDGKELKLVDWEIIVTPQGDPFVPDPANAVWGKGSANCDVELRKLRLLVRDAFTLGANVVLTQMAATLTRRLALPPIDVIEGIKVTPRELFVDSTTVTLSGTIGRAQFQEALNAQFDSEMKRFDEDMAGTDIDAILQSPAAPTDDPAKLAAYLRANVPAYKKLNDRFEEIRKRSGRSTPGPTPPTPLPKQDLFVMLSGNVFDMLAKEYLKADTGGCTEWYGIDILLGYAAGRGCYWFSLKDASGGLSGTTVSMGCKVKAGGGLELKACIRVPCHDDECARWSPGIGLKGPLDVKIALDNAKWDNNRCLRIKASVGRFPGLEVYGLPPVVEDLVNIILNFISEVAFRALINALLSLLDFYIVRVPVKLPWANVEMGLSKLTVGNVSGLLVVGGTTAFK